MRERAFRQAGMWLGASAVGGLILAGCSGDDAGPTSERACAVVQAGELSDLTEVDLELQPAEGDRPVCLFQDDEGTSVVQFTLDQPVEPGLAELLLDEPEPLEGIGNEAWYTERNIPLDGRAMVRRGGVLLTVDLRLAGRPARERKAIATDIAEAAVDSLPEVDAAKPEGARGEEACATYDTEEVAVALGAVPVVTPTAPPGSCEIVAADQGLSVIVSVLRESGATEQDLEGAVAGVPDAEATTIEDQPAYWVTSASGDGSGGQLDLLVDERLLQITVIGSGLAPGDAQAIATVVGTEAVAAAQD